MTVETAAAPVAAPKDPELISWKAGGVHVSAIERELTLLWKSDSEVEGEKHQPVTRTRVLNLIAVTNSGDRASSIKETIGHLAGQHPSRSIILIAHPEMDGGSAALDAEIEAHRLCTGKECDVSWELVTVNARGRAAFHLSSVVTPLLVTDLPTFIWWSGEPPFESDLFARMLDISDRMMVDSLSFSPPYEKDLPKLAKLVRKRGDAVNFSDFNWCRIRPWVEFTTQFFDAACYRSFLHGIDKVSIEYEADRADPDPNPTQGILYAGWLGSRLEWEPKQGKKRLPHGGWLLPLNVPKVGKDVNVEISSREAHKGSRGEIFSITIESKWLGQKARFTIQRSDDRMHATTTTEIDGAAPITKTVEFETYSDSDLLMEELHIVDRDRAYEGALDMASALMGGPKISKPKSSKGGSA